MKLELIFINELTFKIDKFWRIKKRLKRVAPFIVLGLLIPTTFLAYQLTLPQPTQVQDDWPKAMIKGPLFMISTRRSTIPLAIPKGWYSGIENIYIMKHGEYDPSRYLSENSNAWENVITRSDQTVYVRAYKPFDVVVAVRAKAPENMAYANKENLRVWLAASKAFIIPFDHAPDSKEYVFESEGYGTHYGYLRVNVVWDNDGEGYLLRAGDELHIDNLILDLWV